MSNALNSQCFDGLYWQEYARGYQCHKGQFHEYNGGILMPRRIHLRTHQMYFRFADSRKEREKQLTSSWWIEFETLVSIRNYCRRFSTPREAVQYMLAVPWAWNEVDKLISGILEAPLDAYRGRGKLARTADQKNVYIPPLHIEIQQLCIPGLALRAAGEKRTIREIAFPRLQVEDIWSSAYMR